jgi:SpoVK/Ycf46/Vps4 family AAA+-type ATPase
MAQAAAGETGVPFVYVEPGGLQMGGILKVKLLYRKLRKLALKYGGSIVFFDEADSLGARAMRGRGDWGMRGPASAMGATCNGLNYLDPTVLAEANRFAKSTDLEEPPIRSHRFFLMGGGMMGGSIHMLLAEMSGLQKPRGFWNRTIRRALGMRPKPPPRYRILHMFATNLPEALDEAMLRPGRIDRKYRVGYPSLEGRKRTFEGYLAKVSHRLTDEEVTKLSVMTPYYGGADVKDLVNEALVTAIRDGRDTIEWSDVVRAKRNKDLGLPEDVEYVERERHAVAIHEACHAVVSYRMMKVANIDLATIEKGAGYLGMVRNVRAEDLYTAWRTDYEASIMTSVASLAGERLFFFADNSSGVSADLENATFIATMMEGFWGMGRTVASHAITGRAGLGGPRPGPERQGKDESPLEGSLGARIEANLEVLLDRTTKLLKENRHEVLALAYALETLKTLDGADVAAVIDGAKGPIVDGRRYHVMEFQEALERYHEAAARAHEEKGSMADLLPELPILPPPMPAAEVEGSGNGQIEVAAVTPSNAASPPRPDPAT